MVSSFFTQENGKVYFSENVHILFYCNLRRFLLIFFIYSEQFADVILQMQLQTWDEKQKNEKRQKKINSKSWLTNKSLWILNTSLLVCAG